MLPRVPDPDHSIPWRQTRTPATTQDTTWIMPTGLLSTSFAYIMSGRLIFAPLAKRSRLNGAMFA